MVEPAQIQNFCAGELIESKGPIAAILSETKEYITEIDQGLQDSVGKHMCTDTCHCVELDLNRWDTSMQVELSKKASEGGVYVINDNENGYTSFEECYAAKKTLWEAQPDYVPINEDALELEKQLESL